jgi:hypothetical protein
MKAASVQRVILRAVGVVDGLDIREVERNFKHAEVEIVPCFQEKVFGWECMQELRHVEKDIILVCAQSDTAAARGSKCISSDQFADIRWEKMLSGLAVAETQP